jgi:hypothetical protein
MHEWVEVGKLVGIGGPLAALGAGIGAFAGYVSNQEGERAEPMMWCALLGAAVGALIAFGYLAT